MKDNNKTVVYYDADCATCSLYKNNSDNNKITWKPNSTLTRNGEKTKEIVVKNNNETLGGVDAIAFIENSKGNGVLSRILRTGTLKPVFSLGYKMIARYRRHILGPESLFFWLKTVIGLGLMGASLTSWRLWTNWHTFPPAPLLGTMGEFLYKNGSVLLGFLYFALLSALIITRRKTRIITLILLAVSILLVIGDLNRLRPWLYQLLILLTAIVFAKNETVQGHVPQAFVVSLAGTYFWGGLHKANAYFVKEIFPWFISPLTNLFPLHPKATSILAFSVIFIEMLLGLLVLTRKNKNLAIALATLTHGIIVLLLPIGHSWGFVVLFWNLALLVIVWLTSNKKVSETSRLLLIPVITLVWILPIGNWFGVWDNYLSGALYAHETDRGYITIEKSLEKKVTEEMTDKIITWDLDNMAIDTLMWSHQNYNTVLYTSDYAYKAVLDEVCNKLGTGSLYLRAKTRLFWNAPGQTITCETLQSQSE